MTASLGALDLPVAAGASLSAIDDPVVSLLSDYLAWWIKASLDAKLAVQTPTSADACPTANRFLYDPAEYWVRNPTPALYVWSERGQRSQATQVYSVRTRPIRVMYVFQEMVLPGGITARRGLIPAVEAAIIEACERKGHASYSYGGGVAGRPVMHYVASPGQWTFDYAEGQHGFVWPIGEERGQVQRAFPALQATISVVEKVGQVQLADPGDTRGDVAVTIRTNEDGDTTNMLDFMTRYLPADDGDPS